MNTMRERRSPSASARGARADGSRAARREPPPAPAGPARATALDFGAPRAPWAWSSIVEPHAEGSRSTADEGTAECADVTIVAVGVRATRSGRRRSGRSGRGHDRRGATDVASWSSSAAPRRFSLPGRVGPRSLPIVELRSAEAASRNGAAGFANARSAAFSCSTCAASARSVLVTTIRRRSPPAWPTWSWQRCRRR